MSGKTKWADVEDDDEDFAPAPAGGLMAPAGGEPSRKWIDVDDDDDDDLPIGQSLMRNMRTVRTKLPGYTDRYSLTEYKEKEVPAEQAGAAGEGKPPGTKVKRVFKVISIIREREVVRRSNKYVEARKKWKPFGKSHTHKDDPDVIADYGPNHPVRSEEDVTLEMNRERAMKNVGEDEKFFEHSLQVSEEMRKEANKKAYDATAAAKQREKEQEALALEAAKLAGKDGVPVAGMGKGGALAAEMRGEGGKDGGKGSSYVPPTMRAKGGMSDEQKQELTLRVTNLSEDIKEGDLQNLFNRFGRTARVFLAKHREGERAGQSKGFAFVTFHNRQDAEKAKAGLDGHGYDNLILQVNWAKPRAD